MAIDTVDKRRSVAVMPPVPDGSLATPDFQQIGWLYRGIAIQIPDSDTDLLDEIGAWLAAQSVASSSGEDGFFLGLGMMMDSTVLADRMIAVIETGGLAPDAATEVDRPGFQVITRGASTQSVSTAYPEAESKAEAASLALHAIAPGSLSGRHYVGIWATQSHFFLGYDEEGRPLFSQNFLAQRSRT